MAETLSTIAWISYMTAGIFLIIAIAMWFVFKIPAVIGDLSGRNARKSIERLRKNNERTGNKSYRTSKVNEARGKLTEAITETDKKEKNKFKNNKGYETGILNENKADSYLSEETGLLFDNETTEKLPENKKYDAEHHIGGVEITLLEEVLLVNSEEVIR